MLCSSSLGFDHRVGHWATQNDLSILERLLPPMLWKATRSISLAACDVLGMKIPAEVTLWYEQGSIASVTFITHHTLPSAGTRP